MTLPLQLSLFGQLSVLAPLANVLVLWSIPWLMIGGAVAVCFSLIFFPLGQLAAWLTFALMFIIVGVVRLLASLPFAAVETQIPLLVSVGVYVLFLVLYIHYSKRFRYSP